MTISVAVLPNDEQIAARLANLEAAPLGYDEEEDFRISIAGAQGKTALLYWKGGWHIPHGSTATTHILKPQIGDRDGRDFTRSVENEHLCMRILAALDIPVAKTEICDFGDQRALVVERFDRIWTRNGRLLRVPQEDCCQALSVPPTRKYENAGGLSMADLLEFLKASDDPVSERRLQPCAGGAKPDPASRAPANRRILRCRSSVPAIRWGGGTRAIFAQPGGAVYGSHAARSGAVGRRCRRRPSAASSRGPPFVEKDRTPS